MSRRSNPVTVETSSGTCGTAHRAPAPDYAAKYATEHLAFGKPIATFHGVSFLLPIPSCASARTASRCSTPLLTSTPAPPARRPAPARNEREPLLELSPELRDWSIEHVLTMGTAPTRCDLGPEVPWAEPEDGASVDAFVRDGWLWTLVAVAAWSEILDVFEGRRKCSALSLAVPLMEADSGRT